MDEPTEPPLSRFRLCWVKDGNAWFTTLAVTEQWGDDWNDAPYEHNAGQPRDWRPIKYGPLGEEPNDEPRYWLRSIHFDQDGWQTPADIANGNSRYSVEMINAGAVAWLTQGHSYDRTQKRVNIYAGTNIPKFRRLIRAGGGRLYRVA